MTLRRLFPLFAITLLILVAAALRLHLLGAQSFWNDEGSSYVQSIRPFTDIAANAARDIHPPGYYWLLAGWRLLTGTSEFALRALSVFASLLSIAFAYALGRRLYGTVAAFTAAVLITLNTFNIYYAQEARMYALLALWSAASFWALAALFQRKTWRWALALALFNAAGLWTQYAYPFVMLAQGIIALVWLGLYFFSDQTITSLHAKPETDSLRPSLKSGRGRGWGLRLYILANLLTILLYIPWLPTAIHQVTTWPNTGDATPIGDALNAIFQWLTFGSASPGAALAIPVLLMLFGLLSATRWRASQAIWKLLLPPLWVIVPVSLFLALGMFRRDNVKLLLPAQIGLALWLGRGVWVLWTLKLNYGRQRDFASRLAKFVPPATAILSVAWLALIAWDGVAPLYSDPTYQRADYRAIVQNITTNLRAGDAIILDAPNQEEVFRYYYDRTGSDAPIYPLPAGLGGDDTATRARVEQIIAGYHRAFVVYWGEAERDPQRVVETTLDTNAFELDETWYGDVRLARYAMPVDPQIVRESGVQFGDHITLERYALSAATLQQGDALQVRLDWQTDSPLMTRYKVFLQLLDTDGTLVAQRDSEPGGGLALTTTWTPGEIVHDQHALLVDLPPGDYTLIAGLYDLDNPASRLATNRDGDSITLATITVTDSQPGS